MSSLKLRAVETIPEFCLSANGIVVEAMYRPSMVFLSLPEMQSREAATAIVTASSSQLHMDLSPCATAINAGANQPMFW